jgi:hypothetical protein
MEDRLRKNYTTRWGAVLEVIRAAFRAGERDPSRLINQVQIATMRSIVAGPAVRALYGLDEDSTSYALRRLARNFIADTLRDHSDGVDLVMELGSGWGVNLFNLWLRDGPQAVYYALEPIDEGREACDLVATAFDEPRVISAPFDCAEPNIPQMGARHALVFSAAAADKVELVSENLVDQICAIGERVTVLHFESIGHQLSDGPDTAFEEAWQTRSKGKPNRNLWPMLKAAAAAGRIRIDEVRPEVLEGNLCLIRWSAGPDAT